jgi:hypothetical protein
MQTIWMSLTLFSIKTWIIDDYNFNVNASIYVRMLLKTYTKVPVVQHSGIDSKKFTTNVDFTIWN